MKIFGVSEGILGDQIVALPILNYLEEKYPESYKYWYMSKRTRQAAPLYINHPLIDKILIGEKLEGLSKGESYLKHTLCDTFVEEHPNHQDAQWYNERSMLEEAFYMRGLDYKSEYGKPRLDRWWDDGEVNKKTIAIHCVAGYSQGGNRSPSEKWWEKLIGRLHEMDYNIYQFGHENDFIFHEQKGIPQSLRLQGVRIPYRFNHLSLFEQVQLAAKCEYYIGTDSGFSWIMGSCGIANSISLLTDWLPGHTKNPMALAATNWKNNEINLFAKGGCDNIDINYVLDCIK